MDVLSFKPGHDGQIAYIRDGNLEFSIEAEKDNGPRYAGVTPTTMLRAFARLDKIPDVTALSGWTSEFSEKGRPLGAGYFGYSDGAISWQEERWFGGDIKHFTSSHERSHIMCAYGLSPFKQGDPCYVLTWESELGTFYYVDEDVRVSKIADVMRGPGLKYSMLYALADEKFRGRFRMEDAGKLMALAGYGSSGEPSTEERTTIDRVFNSDISVNSFAKDKFIDLPFYNIGLLDPAFATLAKRFSDQLFHAFFKRTRELAFDRHVPLLIAGGCGLNCDWNSAWKELAGFHDVFIPPCCNDSGAAIGTAIDAQFAFTGNAKVSWSVYSGEEFLNDLEDVPGFNVEVMTYTRVAQLLHEGKVLGWVQGRYEIGPRALGNRSILAAPFQTETRDALNRIKEREPFRPIAPICIEEDMELHFEGPRSSPHMLFFHKVKDSRLKAVTHADGSARVQSVSRSSNEQAYSLLAEFKNKSGVAVLCNTSLNFKGAGFINRLSDLAHYALTAGLDGFVVHNRLYLTHR
ncbi:carbamoyltransferase C-terminal domain-containing protein [Agrobacterium tumefaciens]|uniref:Proline dehydrogenase n=1 Tax=Agrobacterium tumefaciens TaxID=358 RepID=A0AA44FC10_AGRTU|nr:carbamoyltransferase C-terminal domain-containing protein [Agrobacterium tumefaciens]NTB87723.1 proline dehydrogenase [Agrobacterium tumefaciens]NTC32054.1 proline dehydrogenase [Agrobacterium tumefaciens]